MMPRLSLNKMTAALKAQGVRVEVAAGAATRGSAAFNPKGVVCHWTAGPKRATGRPSLRVVTHGRPGLPGPLCQVYLDRNGTAVIVATGRANHAGRGSFRGLSGNSSVLGIEAECGGDGDWTDAQRKAYPRVVAGLLSLIGRSEAWACGHNEWTSRKIDIRDWDMARMRREVKIVLRGGTPTPGPAAHVGDDSPKYTPVKAGDLIKLYSRGEAVKEVQRAIGVRADGYFGPESEKALRAFQKRHGLTVDGIAGPKTMAKVREALAPKKPAAGAPKASAFPLRKGHYFGPKSGPKQSVSGYYSHREDLRTWQRQMLKRGWKGIGKADGLYGAKTAMVVRQFQKEKRLAVDGLIGPATWSAAWESPIT